MPATARTLLTSDVVHLATTTVGSQLQIGYVLFTRPRPLDRADELGRKADETVRRSAHFLEFLLVAVCAHEALAEIGAETLELPTKEHPIFMERVRALTGLDPFQVIREAEKIGMLQNLPVVEPRMPPLAEVVRVVRTVIEACPIARLEVLADERQLQAWGHRCRVAYEALRAFILRRDPREQDRLGIVGREYSSGALSVPEVAALLHVDEPDAVALLEDYGYIRPIERILLSDDSRSALYARMRADRLNRSGRYEPTAERIARDVIASERIEGVDARRWISTQVE